MTDLNLLFLEYRKKGHDIFGPIEIRSGKEATVYRVERSTGGVYALKVYTKTEERAFRRNEQYVDGTFRKNHGLRKAISKGNEFSKDFLAASWVKREFDIMKNLNKHGASIPQVIDWTSSSILMEFIGDGEAAPRLIDIDLEPADAKKAFDSIVESMTLFLKTGIVHSDLSAYNILWWKEKPCVIDFPQAIDIRQNPNTNELLKRDIDNVCSYFQKYIKVDKESLYAKFKLQ